MTAPVALCREALKGSDVKVGFPHGNNTTQIKVAETEQAIREGAAEIDMVINIGKALGDDWNYVRADVEAVNQACLRNSATLKVIFETNYLPDEHVIRLCRICSELKVAFVKTSTGFGFVKPAGGDYNHEGATEHVLSIMRRNSAPGVQVKASGGVRILDQLLKVRELGCTRCGATVTEFMPEEAKKRGYS